MTSPNHETARAIADYLSAQLGESVSPETDLLAEGLLESLTMMDLIAQLERRYGVKFGPEDIAPAAFRTANCIARLVDEKRSMIAPNAAIPS